MTQNRDTGAEASEYGHRTAALIAEKLGARKLTKHSNEFEWQGQRVAIHSARQRTNSVGVVYTMLKRVTLVIGAFEVAPKEYDLYSLPPATYEKHMRDSRSRTGRGKVGLVTKKVFERDGAHVRRINLATFDQ